jgi:hypothetical protein
MNKIHYVYLTTNLINGKQYVGDHTINIKEKKYYIGSGDIFLKACKKYGEYNFFKEILEWFKTRKEAFNAQEKYIKQFDTLSPNGYNISPTGGHGTNGGYLSKETKKKISDKQKGIPKISFFIKKYGELEGNKKYQLSLESYRKKRIGTTTNRKGKGFKKEFIEIYGEKEGIIKYENFVKKQSEAKKGKVTWRNGVKASSETKEKISKSHLGIKQSKETKEKRANKLRGLKRSEESKLKMSLSSIGKPKKYLVWNKNKTTLNLSKDIINNIKNLALSKIYQKDIAKKYNLSISCIARIIKGKYDNFLNIK